MAVRQRRVRAARVGTVPPYEHPGANIAFWTLFGLFALGEFAIRFRSRFDRSGTRAERWSLLVVIAAVVGGMLAGIALANRDVGSIVSARRSMVTTLLGQLRPRHARGLPDRVAARPNASASQQVARRFVLQRAPALVL
jgi:hypothetical protein